MRWIALLLVAGVISLSACREDGLPEPPSEAYREAVASFYAGLAAMQVGESRLAVDNLRRVTELAPGEPAAWANLGLVALQQNDLDQAAQHLETARALAPDNSRLHLLTGRVEQARGEAAEAAAFFRRALALDPGNLQAAYALTHLLEQQERTAEAQGLLDTLLAAEPNNLVLLLDQARLAAARGDLDRLQAMIDRVAAQAGTWPSAVRAQFASLQAALADTSQAATQVAFIQNVLKQLPAYRADLAVLQPPPQQVGLPMTRFLRLMAPRPMPAPPDDSLTFVAAPLFEDATEPWAWVGIVVLDDQTTPAVLLADSERLQPDANTILPFPGDGIPPSQHSIAGVDFTYDFLTDLVLAGAGELRLLQQIRAGTFVDVTADTGLPPAITEAAYAGAWGADLDMEGDLDLVLAPTEGPPRVLRNNGDGTFSPWDVFESDLAGLRDFAWADLDLDGDPDAAFLDANGRVRVFENRRSRGFQPFDFPQLDDATAALAVADVNTDGTFGLLLLRQDGTVLRCSRGDTTWSREEIAVWSDAPTSLEPGTARLVVADLDNNGGLDLLASGPAGAQIWLSDQAGAFHPHGDSIATPVFDVADLTGDGYLDLVSLSDEGQPLLLTARSTLPYSARSMRPRAATVQGDQRINPFGIGGEIEVRAGLLYQKQPITRPIVHFGLGDQSVIDVARIIWPNGDVQAEFNLASDQTVLTRQRLKGSCPWVFTFDGEGMQFVTDFLWRSPLGLAINAQETAGIMTTEDWVRIRSDQLVPRNGAYDVRITAELWETHFFDHVSLLVVDHPVGTEIFVDERFAFPPPPPAVQATAPLHPVTRAVDDQGKDVTDLVRARDARYLGGFALGPYQGVAQDHYVEVDLSDAPSDGPLWLVAMGWVRPTDSSINVSLSQGDHAPPTGLSVEVPDGHGGWVVARENLGFPSGKSKTILIDVTGVFRPEAPRRLRLRTNLEVYWDALAWTRPLPETDLRTQRLQPETADLRYRGFSVVTEANHSSPEIPHYDQLKGTAPIWQDLTGYYTRFGDVRELLAEIDDRYVIMNAGDELAFRFPAPPPPPEGRTRDFVLIGDGWNKDGDYNTTFSATVRPLPSHDQPSYTTPPGPLVDDPVYQRYPDDWRTYHTRYVTPEPFRGALLLGGNAGVPSNK